MTTPTAQEIDVALRMLPARPDASILLGDGDGEEDRYGEVEMFADILAYGHVRGPREEAEAAAAAGTAGRWEQAWRGAPLVIHDTGLVGAISALAPDLVDVSESVIMDAIVDVIEEHPGPVGCLRMESCPSPDAVGRLMDRLRATRGEDGLHELIAVNANRPKNEACFPLPCLPSGLRRLALCFFLLRPLEADHLTGLTELTLTACEFCGQALSAVIPEMRGLRTLVMGWCQLTTGCGPDGLDIVSTNLRCLHMWTCLAAGGVYLQYTPRLEYLCTGVRPHQRNTRLLINLRTPGALREFHGLVMSCHELSFMSAVNEKLRGQRIAPLPCLVTMNVRVRMSTSKEILDLLHLLRHIPHLKDLTLERADDTHQDEEELTAEQQAFEAPCIRYSLKVLVLDQFRGGNVEIAFAIRVLAKATSLSSLGLKPHTGLTETQGANACALLLNCPRASAGCAIQLI